MPMNNESTVLNVDLWTDETCNALGLEMLP